MVDFAKADFTTDPTPLTVTVTPTVSGSDSIKLQLQPLPKFSINYKPDGSGWEKFNADTGKHVATTLIAEITPFVTATLQTKGQGYLDGQAVTVPPIPLTYQGISLTLTPSNLNISTSDSDHVLVSATVKIA